MQLSLFQLNKGINILPYDGEALFYPDFLSPKESRLYFNHILKTFEWKQEMITLYDKEMLQPRLTAVCGDPHPSFSNPDRIIHPYPWTAPLLDMKHSVEGIANVRFTHALFNLYRDGKDSVSWHRDNERYLGNNPVIASVSLGEIRTFQFRYYTDKKITRSVELTPGSLLIMQGKTQHCWEHQVPKTNKRVGQRINITFRIRI